MIDEQRLQTALDKIATMREQTKIKLRQYDEIINAIISIRRIQINTPQVDAKGDPILDIDGKPIIDITFELPKDNMTQDIVSPQRRQEIYDKLVVMIEAL